MTYTHLNTLSDEAVMEHLKERHGDALAILFRRYQRLVFSIAMKVLRDLGEAEDMTQNVFMEVYRSAAVYDSSRSPAKIWILKYAYHLSLNRRRHLTSRNFYTAADVAEVGDLTPELSAGDMTYPEKQRLVQQALEKLNQQQKRVLELAFFEGLTMQEIATRTGDTLGNVRHYYYRGMDKLREEVCAVSATDVKYVHKEISSAEA